MEFPIEKIYLGKIRGVYNINSKEKSRVSRNDRRFAAIALKLSGKTEYKCDSKCYLCDEKHVILIPKNKKYSYEILELGECIMIEFECEGDLEFCSYRVSDNAKIRSLFLEIYQTYAAKSGRYMLSVMSDFYSILHTLYVFSNIDYAVQKKEKELLPAVTYMQTHYAENDITNDFLAEMVGMSTVYFRKLFTKRYGVSPMKYLGNIRIETAKNLLLGNGNTVSEIAEAVGFLSVYSFSRAFKNQLGISPTAFLKSNTNFSF